MTTHIKPSAKDVKVAVAITKALTEEHSTIPGILNLGNQSFELTPNFSVLIEKIAQAFQASQPLTLSTYESMMTTQEAADYLGYSRPTLIKLLGKFNVTYSKVGRHRKIKAKDVEQLRLDIREDQRNFLREMSKLEQELGMDE